MKIKEYLMPINIEDAYEHLMDQKNAVLIAGGMFLRLQNRTLPLVIDLANLGLDTITEDADFFRIGSMTTLRTLEKSQALPTALRDSTKQIAGVALRNVATIGGSIMGRYPFSDLCTALVALGAKLSFYASGEVEMAHFLKDGIKDLDILLEIRVPKSQQSLFKAYKVVYTDFSLVNLAICKTDVVRLAIGATPGRAISIDVDKLADIDALLERFEFSDDFRASGDYRKALAKALIEDALEEVQGWK